MRRHKILLVRSAFSEPCSDIVINSHRHAAEIPPPPPRATPRRPSAQSTIRISGADLPPSLGTGLFNPLPSSRYGEAERSELGVFARAARRRRAKNQPVKEPSTTPTLE